MDTVTLTAQAKPADVVALVTVLSTTVKPCDEIKHKVGWLLDLAAALDVLTMDGAADLADTARTAALSLVSRRLDFVIGKSR